MGDATWKRAVEVHKQPVLGRSLWQVVNTLVPYIGLWIAMAFTIQHSYWITLPLAVLAAGFLVRTFIIFHDCTHGSFFHSRRANDALGFVTGVLSFTPYHKWRRDHALHHGTAGDLDRRGTGDVWTLTVEEYLQAGRWKRFAYRLARNPVVLFVLAPLYLFLIEHRFPRLKTSERDRKGVLWTNVAILVVAGGMCFFIGWLPYLLIQMTVLLIAASAGIWLFYVQHQFEGVYWERQEDWDFVQAALAGSSYYKLPKVLQWFTGNIGFHHLHHLCPTIPNYNLERCHHAHPRFREVGAITLWGSWKCLWYRVWDEQRRRLIGYRELRRLRRGRLDSIAGKGVHH